MTRKHYNAIAKLFNECTEPVALLDGLIKIFEDDNPRFDRQRFIDAVLNGGE